MTRALGFVDAVAGLPDPVVFAFAVLTQLGDTWFLVALVTVYFWRRDRTDGAFVLAATLGAFALTLALKGVFALPRPPTQPTVTGPALLVEFFETVSAADGYGFPSGHALGAAAVYGALAVRESLGDRNRTLGFAAVIGVVAVSRVVIGVHYAVDVVAGVALGLGYVWVTTTVGRGDPVKWFGLAAVVSIVAVVVTGGVHAFALAGATVGAVLAWTRLDVTGVTVPWRTVVPGLGLVAVGWVGATEALPLVLVPLASALVVLVLVLVPQYGGETLASVR